MLISIMYLKKIYDISDLVNKLIKSKYIYFFIFLLDTVQIGWTQLAQPGHRSKPVTGWAQQARVIWFTRACANCELNNEQ